ncbi:hypothetical protein PHYBLDRAFT_68252 [Phycomyces blakesleeanus NRRL 1555(-)]|uniref:Uncharacterized protein n=1 Tax=Phycomyces blakesleeanus (strain ATCC 8743b / DSM 1359 / FGSC 10004 / NBRC 33097 / NRRL 1555) TaxID=763407 RepID=A0A162TE59_PHYB8|nr:hypothetical protein PHYBLDRAFT_68252 [Phycomyces blakesleeanus NRRL 1555(-)]OAD67882.1 hypothetical protein PHYBLDRAFT_68252 [Phycomyces blakesleeanus NRRL 1555(-)]|eukprot:XP_018285922.1 hypothetical protein PHYBLDRAFT_68252 [Phycomyces blakesleeanus NRRL 1555(-)]
MIPVGYQRASRAEHTARIDIFEVVHSNSLPHCGIPLIFTRYWDLRNSQQGLTNMNIFQVIPIGVTATGRHGNRYKRRYIIGRGLQSNAVHFNEFSKKSKEESSRIRIKMTREKYTEKFIKELTNIARDSSV